MRIGKWLGVLGVLAVPGSTLAHHGWSGYDSGKLLTLEGVIRESGYENPHGFIALEGEGKKTWHVVLAPPTRMENRGLSRDELATGTRVSVEGYPHRTRAGELRAERITVGGETVELR